MKRFLLLILFFFSFLNLYSQLDREHWFAPMVDRVNNTTSPYQSIYMSTNETTPFNVEIYHNNVVVATVSISKNNPVKYSIPNSQRNRIITTTQSNLFKPVAMGFYLKGVRPFYASLRFSILNHGEMQTSKGTAALGTEFRAVVAPITVNNGILNFMNSIMATEDNTTVTVSEFKPTVRFSDGVTRTQITFTLNKGQSYIIDGYGNNSGNFTGYIGAKIVSDKPIVIANGNFNGQYAGNFSNASDILMDQGVPVNKLGQEFVLMKGNGTASQNMEKAIILATEDNTQIYLNNGTAPVATLNTGQYYQTTTTAYINQGSQHYNMYIKASKNVYVYQLLAGTDEFNGTEEATGGFNYIPPLSCYLPMKIDEIGRIDENEYSSNGVGYSLSVATKLNIITENGATVTVTRNGIPLVLNASNGPYNVSGNTNWKTYSIPNITGNIAVTSSHAVTAGISAGNDAVGYGGYFAGFSYTPAIIKQEGDCLPGVKLSVTEGFNTYLWVLKDGAGNYNPAPGINNLNVYEPSQAGIYAVKIQQGSCAAIQTQDFKFFNCTTYTNINYSTCSTQEITPVFALSSQLLNAPTVKIDTPPTKGTAVIQPDGKILYTANPNATGIDTFKYSFCGIGTIPDCESVQATITINQIEKYDVILRECGTNGIATYNLSNAAVTPATNITVRKYYTDAALTQLIPAANVNNYSSADGFVYVELENSFGCKAIAKIELKSKLSPVVTPNLYTITHCDEDSDGIADGVFMVNLNSITPIVLQNPTAFTVKYYDTQAKAIAGLNDNISGTYSFTSNTSVWIRVESPDGCAPNIKEIQLKTGTKAVLLAQIVTKNVCDNDINISEAVDLSTYISFFSNVAGTTAKYFANITDAQNNQNAIPQNQTISGDKTFLEVTI